MRETGGQLVSGKRSLEGIVPHLEGDLERVVVGDVADAAAEIRALVPKRIEQSRTAP